jgi:hypothetical protein
MACRPGELVLESEFVLIFSNSKTSDKINGRSKPGDLMQTSIEGTEYSYHSLPIYFGSDKLFKKTPSVCRAKLKCSHLQYA